MMAGTLYLVPTPIGNLGDISERCSRTLEQADFIAAEDTRVSIKLLNHLGLKKSLVSYHEHNKAESGQRILSRLQAGESCALITDAGTPAISDPGEALVRLCADNGITVSALPGPCAAVTALSLSALPTGRFAFEGFLPVQKKERQLRLAALSREERTLIFYEAPHRLKDTLQALLLSFGAERRISLCRELTKLHEDILRTSLGEAVAFYEANEPRGEFVLVLEGCPAANVESSFEEALALVDTYIGKGMTKKDAVRQVSLDTGFSKNRLYEAVMK